MVLAAAAMALLILGVWRGEGSARLVSWLAIGVLIYGFTGTTAFDDLTKLLTSGMPVETGVLIGLVFVVVGLAFKVSAVPFHMWTPDVYEGAPTPVSAFFAVAPKLAALALFIRFMIAPFGPLIDEWRQV